jgi:hypothetical protein
MRGRESRPVELLPRVLCLATGATLRSRAAVAGIFALGIGSAVGAARALVKLGRILGWGDLVFFRARGGAHARSSLEVLAASV